MQIVSKQSRRDHGRSEHAFADIMTLSLLPKRKFYKYFMKFYKRAKDETRKFNGLELSYYSVRLLNESLPGETCFYLPCDFWRYSLPGLKPIAGRIYSHLLTFHNRSAAWRRNVNRFKND